MRKYQKFVLTLSLLLAVAQVVDAAPRNRRRARRAAQARSYSSNNTYRQVSTPNAYAVQPTNQPVVQPTSATQGWSNPISSGSVTTSVETAVTRVEPRTLDVGDALPLDPATAHASTVVQASYAAPAVSTSPAASVDVAGYVQSPAPIYTASTTVRTGGAIAEVNAIRARRGLPPFIEDASLSAVAYQKASIQANRGSMGHPGGSMGGARFEGVGMGREFVSCYLYSSGGQYAGAASVQGRNGQRYHCLLVR